MEEHIDETTTFITNSAAQLPNTDRKKSCDQTGNNFVPSVKDAGVAKKHSMTEKHQLLSYVCNNQVTDMLTWLLVAVSLWGFFVSTFGSEGLPGGNLFSLLVLFLIGRALSLLFRALHLPLPLSMLLTGVLSTNLPGFSVLGRAIESHWGLTVRGFMFTLMLIRSGLGLDEYHLQKGQFIWMVFKISILSCLVEMGVCTIMTHFLLEQPWSWACMLGFVVAAVTPAISLPSMLILVGKGLGLNIGVPTLIMACVPIENIIILTGFFTMLAVNLTEGSATWELAKGGISIVLGLGFAAVTGGASWYLPHWQQPNRHFVRFSYILVQGCLILFGSIALGYHAAGFLGCMAQAFVAQIGWKKKGADEHIPVQLYFNNVWRYTYPIMYILIGYQLRITMMEVHKLPQAFIIVFVGIVSRLITSFLSTHGGQLSVKERLFVAIAWSPKATTQVAICPIALDTATRMLLPEDSPEVKMSKELLTVATLAVSLMAPIGASATKFTSTRFLHRTVSPSCQTKEEISNAKVKESP